MLITFIIFIMISQTQRLNAILNFQV